MKVIKQYKWRIQWAGKWTTTNHHATEEDIKVNNPEAICLPHTLIEREIPETDAEILANNRRTCTGILTNPNTYRPPAEFLSSFSDDVPF